MSIPWEPVGEFDPWKASTWNSHEQAVYQTGYEEGGRGNAADWAIALDELTEIEDSWATPWEVAAYIAKLEAAAKVGAS